MHVVAIYPLVRGMPSKFHVFFLVSYQSSVSSRQKGMFRAFEDVRGIIDRYTIMIIVVSWLSLFLDLF
jgi:hypothetical protein